MIHPAVIPSTTPARHRLGRHHLTWRNAHRLTWRNARRRRLSTVGGKHADPIWRHVDRR